MLYKKTFASATQSRLPPVPGWGETADHFAAPLCQQCTVLSLIWRIWILFLNSIQELLAPILGWRPSCHEIIWSKLRYEPSRWTGGQAFAVQIYAWPQDMTQSIRFSSNFVTCLMANVMHSSHVALKKKRKNTRVQRISCMAGFSLVFGAVLTEMVACLDETYWDLIGNVVQLFITWMQNGITLSPESKAAFVIVEVPETWSFWLDLKAWSTALMGSTMISQFKIHGPIGMLERRCGQEQMKMIEDHIRLS